MLNPKWFFFTYTLLNEDIARTEKEYQTRRRFEQIIYKPTRPIGNQWRLNTILCHFSSKWCRCPDYMRRVLPLFRLARGLEECPVVVCNNLFFVRLPHKQDSKTKGPKRKKRGHSKNSPNSARWRELIHVITIQRGSVFSEEVWTRPVMELSFILTR